MKQLVLRLTTHVAFVGACACTSVSETSPASTQTAVEGGSACTAETSLGAGLGRRTLGSDRLGSVAADVDVHRMKPLSALRGEYERVLGLRPALLDEVGDSFGATVPRWSMEPERGALAVFTAFRVAFRGCTEFGSKRTAWDDVADAAKVRAECATLARTFFGRVATEAELDACGQIVTTSPTDGTGSAPKERFAYACASLLTSADFLSY